MITPTVGRVVWFHPAPKTTEQNASVAAVNADGTVNLTVSHENGHPYGVQNVPLVQPEERPPEEGHYCEWMPYQISQAEAATDDGTEVSPTTTKKRK